MTMEKMGAVPSSEVPVSKPGESGIKQKAEAGSYFIRLLQQRLDDLQPEKISPRWIELADIVLYKELLREARTPEGEVDWQRIVSHLSPQWQAAWKRGEEVADTTKSQKVKVSLVPNLKKLLKEAEVTQPKVKKAEKDILPVKKEKKTARRMKDFLPSETYADSNEVNEVIAPYKDGLYSFASLDWERPIIDHELQKQLKRMAEKGNELAKKRLAEMQIMPQDIRKMRHDVIGVLIGLARKGNTSANDKLLELTEPLVQGWLDKDANLSVYKHDPERLQKIFERCIFLYAEKGEFLDYLRSSLSLHAKGLKHQVARSLDAEMGESGQNLLDRLGTFHEPGSEGEEEEEDQEQEVYTFGKKSGPTIKAA